MILYQSLNFKFLKAPNVVFHIGEVSRGDTAPYFPGCEQVATWWNYDWWYVFSNCRTKVLNGSAIGSNFHPVGALLAAPHALFCTLMRPSNTSKRLTDSSRHGCLLKALLIRVTLAFLKNSFHWPSWDMLLEEHDSAMSFITADLKELEERSLLCSVHCFKAASPPSLTLPLAMYLDRTSWRQENDGQPTIKHSPPITYFSHLLKFPQLLQPARTVEIKYRILKGESMGSPSLFKP